MGLIVKVTRLLMLIICDKLYFRVPCSFNDEINEINEIFFAPLMRFSLLPVRFSC